jgi:hypothetical protein
VRTESKIKNGMRYKGRDGVSKYKKMAYRNSAKKKSVSVRYKEWPKGSPSIVNEKYEKYENTKQNLVFFRFLRFSTKFEALRISYFS